ncbi:MAG TPA: DMT family transporter [Acidocella sp.]|nr:DMT family transporter [Acidocella sp.]
MSYAAALPGRRKIPPEAVLIIITVVWGFTFLIIKTGLAQGGALALVGLRFAIGAALLSAIARPAWPRTHEWRAGFLIGASLFAGYGLQAQGLITIPSSRSGFFTALYVPLVPLLQFMFLGKRPSASGLLGLIMAFLGLVLLSHPDGLRLHLATGDVLTIFCALACAIEIILLGRFAPDCDPQRLAVVQMTVVALLSLGTGIVGGAVVPWHYPPFLAAVAALGVATALIMFGQTWGQARVPALRATVIYAMEPVWAGMVGAVAGDPMDAATLAGAGMILAGLLVEPAWNFMRATRGAA